MSTDDLSTKGEGWTPLEVIRRIAEAANRMSIAAGVGGMELAGNMISVLATHPEHVDRFMREGGGLFIDEPWLLGAENGCLTFYNTKGEITTPQELAASRAARKEELAALSLARGQTPGASNG